MLAAIQGEQRRVLPNTLYDLYWVCTIVLSHQTRNRTLVLDYFMD